MVFTRKIRAEGDGQSGKLPRIMIVYPVVLCGGSGTRLWPLSRSLLPKQFLPLCGPRTMLQETVRRLARLPLAPPVIVSNAEHRFIAAEQMRELGISLSMHLLEPVGRNTAPAVAAAALKLLETQKDDDVLLLILPSDHQITKVDSFREAILTGHDVARAGRLVTFGIVPTHPATGYGYIRRGAATAETAECFDVSQFVEKPDAVRAQHYLAAGEYYWNSGMFLFRAGRFLDELSRCRPEMMAGVEDAVRKSKADTDFVWLDEEAFSRCPADSIDYAVMESTTLASVVPVNMGWSDVGSWTALWDIEQRDSQGNSVRGDVYLDQAVNSYVRAEARLVAAIGVRDLVIVETNDAVLVADKGCTESVKQLVERLTAENRSEPVSSRRVYRPWGYYESIDASNGYQVKRLMVKAGSRISLQLHRRRAEHWVVVSGQARITRDKDVITLGPNQSTYIPIGMRHRLENPGTQPLYVIEVQSGDYLGEDDIQRFDDDYRRA